MATVPPPRELKIGKIIDKTLAVLEHNAVSAAIFVGGLTLINGAIAYFSLGLEAPVQQLEIGLAQFVIGVVFAYWMLDGALRTTGLRTRKEGQVLLPYFALSVLYTLGVVFGLLLVIIGALIFMARWSIAQSLLVGRGASVFEAFGESWERTKGNEVQIIAAALALLVPLIVMVILAGVLFDPEGVVGIGISQLATSAISLVSIAMGVALYGLMGGVRDAVAPTN